ncbi:hypothetical protein LUZ60_017538 [Juncus effusus]|nr:hypothetical protein LUZ60_017538 [Juncus effusus]
MTETIVNGVIGKLCDVLVQQAISLYNIGDQVEAVKRELGWIKCFLRDADSKRKANERVKHWIGEVRDVAYRIEDVIDTFLVEFDCIDQSNPRGPNFLYPLKKIKKSLEELPACRKLDEEITKIRETIRDSLDRRNAYGIKDLDEGSEKEIRLPARRLVLPAFGDIEVVGLQYDTENIIKHLVDASISRRLVISIVGPGGLGKTTLAQKAYKSAVDKAYFEFHIWLSISQEFNIADLFKKMLKELGGTESLEQEETEAYFIVEINKFLKMKKYLIILDDVWTEDLWTQLEAALPDDKNGSRVLMTTRNRDVALAGSQGKPYELKFLSNKESEELLLKKAFPYQDPDNHDDLMDLAKQLAKKCGGLPLALVVVGGLLSRKPATYRDWHKVFCGMNWHADGKRCMDILASSYEDLPVHLKSCFMYFACFPEDFLIPADAIMKMWVAEGFISEEIEGTMEDISESYLEELVQRCMVGVIERASDGSLRYIRIHDLLRDLAIKEAKAESNLAILSKQGARQITKRTSRRAMLQGCNSEMMEFIAPNLRSLLCFDNFLPDCSGFRLLKVLSVTKVGLGDEYQLDWLRNLIHLKYLAFTSCWNKLKLPNDIGHCKNLQTLDLKGTQISELPESLWVIKALRHVIIDTWVDSVVARLPALAKLTDLQTLTFVEVHKSWMIGSLPSLNNVRKLGLYNRSVIHWEIVANFLGELDHLVSLCLKGDRFTREILDTKNFPNCENILSMELIGDWSKSVALNASLFPMHLTELTLFASKLEQDPMPQLMLLRSLSDLTLGREAYIGNQMTCSFGGFHRLQRLTVYGLGNLEFLRIEEHALPVLNKFVLGTCLKLKMLPDLQNIPTLSKLTLYSMLEQFKSRLEKEDNHKLQHVPLIKIW